MQNVAKQNVSHDSGVSKRTQSISFVIIGTSSSGALASKSVVGAAKTRARCRPKNAMKGRDTVVRILLVIGSQVKQENAWGF